MEVLTRKVFLCTDSISHNYGYGYYDGDGDSDGSGYGYGYGDGKGKTNGSGYGCGSSEDYGYCPGYGQGSGYGTGYGYGDGSGIKYLNGQIIDYIDNIPTILTHIIGNSASGFIVRSDFSLIPTFIYKYGNMFAHGETLNKAREAMLEKLFDNMPTEERIEAFCVKFKPGVKRPAMDFFLWHHRLTGSCEQGRREFAQQHNIDIDSDEMTPEEFFALTRNSYGSNIIQQTEKVFACRYKAELVD